MKTFDLEVLNSIVDSIDVSANVIYDTTSIYGFEKAVHLEAKYQLYSKLCSVQEYLGINPNLVTTLVDRLYEINKDLFIQQAAHSFEEEYA